MNIPSINRKEWKNLLTKDFDVTLQNYFFQMKVTQARKQIQKGRVSVDSAVKDLHALCDKFSTAKNMTEDLTSVFGENYLEEPKEETPVKLHELTNLDELINDDVYVQLRYEKEILFYKKESEKNQEEVKEKDKEIVTLQADVVFLKKKVNILQDALKEMEEIKIASIDEEDKKNGGLNKFLKKI